MTSGTNLSISKRRHEYPKTLYFMMIIIQHCALSFKDIVELMLFLTYSSVVSEVETSKSHDSGTTINYN